MVAQRGVALAIVVWFLAAMAVLVSGIVWEARLDVKLAQAHVARAEVESAGDGAIQLALAQLASGVVPLEASSAAEYEVGGHRVRVELIPVSGLININAASRDLLGFLFLEVGGMAPSQAEAAAAAVIEFREIGTGMGLGGLRRVKGFESVEDLVRVAGINRAVFDRVRDHIVARSGGGGMVDWSAAPEGLLTRFAEKYPREVQAALKRREKVSDLIGDPRGATSGQTRSGNFRVDATVLYGDKAWIRRRWVTMESTSGSLLPWTVTRTEGPRVRTTT
ncbi:MAG: hypothetical protein AAGI11_17280 [Pseudomonadota bacterium]